MAAWVPEIGEIITAILSLLLKGQAQYADVMELALYNGVLSGISIYGNKFSYENPLASQGSQRDAWIGLACCPANLTRIIPQVGDSPTHAANDGFMSTSTPPEKLR